MFDRVSWSLLAHDTDHLHCVLIGWTNDDSTAIQSPLYCTTILWAMFSVMMLFSFLCSASRQLRQNLHSAPPPTHTMGSRTPVVDAHYHLWSPQSHSWLRDVKHPSPADAKLDFTPIAQRFDTEQHLELLAQAGLSYNHGVFVQCGWHSGGRDPVGETEWALQQQGPRAVVGYADVDKPNMLRDQLARHRQYQQFCGIRFMLDWDPVRPGLRQTTRSDWMRDPGFVEGLGVLEAMRGAVSFDLQVCQCQLTEAAQLAARFPALTFVLNHAGFPLGNAQDDGAMLRGVSTEVSQPVQRCWWSGSRAWQR